MRQIPKIHALLHCLASDEATVQLAQFDQAEIDWIVSAGLAPLLLAHADTQAECADLSSLRAGDLTAKLMTGVFIEAMTEILQTAGARAAEITLLKGISVCTDLYTKPHHRMMGDIDLLVAANSQKWLESLLTDLGYEQRSALSAEFYARHSHSMPFHNKRQPVCIEVHTALFPAQMAVAQTPLFAVEELMQLRMADRFAGFPVQRLRPEVQLAYIASHMAERLTFAREASAFVDIVLLLRKYGAVFDWDRFVGSLGEGVAVNHSYAVLSYLQAHGLVSVPAAVLVKMASRSSGLGRFNLQLLHTIMGRYLLSPPHFSGLITDWTLQLAWETLLQSRPACLNLLAVPWNVVFIPKHPQRFSPAFHWWRLRSWWGKLQ